MVSRIKLSIYSTIVILVVCLSLQITCRVSAQKISFFVSPQGNDSSSGNFKKPFRHIETALNAIASKKNSEVTVFLRAGNYELEKQISIKGSDLNGNKVLITSYQNELVTIVGGKTLSNDLFHLVTDVTFLDRLPKKSKGKVYVTNLFDQGVSNNGNLKKNGFGASRKPSALELFDKQQPLTISRWPNEGGIAVDSVLFKGENNSANPPAFTYSSDQPKSWLNDSNIWVAGQFAVGWAFDNLPVDHLDATNGTVFLKDKASYGIYSSNDVSTGVIASARKVRNFYFYNVLEELDSSGEWYLDRDTKMLYLYPINTIENSELQVSLLEEPMLTIENTRDITISNITFTCTRGYAIEIKNSQNILVKNCAISNTGLEAITTANCNDINISRCKVSNTGAGGITLSGGNRKILTAGRNIVENTEFINFSRLYKTYSPAVNINGVANQVQNCYIHNAEGQAIIFSGNNHRIVSNKIENVCTFFNDIGAIYTGRDPSSTGTTIENNLFQNIHNQTSNMVAAVYIDDGSGGMKVGNNIFYKCGNIIGFGAIHINGGAYNMFDNNVFVDCPRAFSHNIWTDKKWETTFFRNTANLNKIIKDVDIRTNIYTSAYPFLKGFFDTSFRSQYRQINYIKNTILYGVGNIGIDSTFIEKNIFNGPAILVQNEKEFKLPSPPKQVLDWDLWKIVETDKIGIID